MTICKDVRGNPALRAEFFAMAREIFGIPFEEWYARGYWTDRYRPYAAISDGALAACAAVNVMELSRFGEALRCVQIGTVMTAPERRGRGFARALIEEILGDWAGACDCVYLFANPGVAEFYPKFGFQRAEERDFSLPIAARGGKIRRLNMADARDVRLLADTYARSNPFSALHMRDNFPLVMFYCMSMLQSGVLYIEELDAIVLAEREGDALICHDIYGGERADMADILAIAGEGARTARLGFAPKDAAGCVAEPLAEEDTLLFTLGAGNPLAGGLRFPSLSRA